MQKATAAIWLLLICLTSPSPVWGEDLFREPCAAAGIPRDLALAIARQESSLDPLAINVEGKDYHPLSYDDAVSIIEEADAAGLSYDVGVMQINNQWTRRWKLDPLELLNPHRNVQLGISILEQEIKRHGRTWRAVGKYHSPNEERGRRYAWRVYKRMAGQVYAPEEEATTGKTAKNADQNLCDGSGVWRNHGVQRKGRLVTFGVREASVLRLNGQNPREQPANSESSEGER